MRFILTPAGSYGDVHPYVGIGRRLRERGHSVTVLTAGPFRDLVESSGLEYVSTWPDEDYDRLTQDPDLWHPKRGLALLLRTTAAHLRDGYRLIDEVYEPGSVLVGHLLAFSTRVFEDKQAAPAASIVLAPSGIRSTYRIPPFVPGIDVSGLPRPLKRAFLRLVDRFLIHPHLVPELNRFRAELGLDPVYRPFKEWLLSPRLALALFPYWFGDPQPDWPAQLAEVGFPLFDEAGRRHVPPPLDAFLSAAETDGGPVVFTPGSAHRQGHRFFDVAIGAARRLGKPALLLTGFREQLPDPLPDDVVHADYAPFSRVLPRCAAIVHHGGIGTLSQGLSAGVPQLVMPMAYDQPDNAARLRQLGVGDWLRPDHFDADRVAAKLERLISTPRVAAACSTYREALLGSDAIGTACDLLESLASGAGAPIPHRTKERVS